MRAWRVVDVMTKDVVTVGPDAPYREILDFLARRRVSGLPVLDEAGRILGVVSEVDLLHRVEAVAEAGGHRPFHGRHHRVARARTVGDTARDLMTAPAVVVRCTAPVAEAARLMDTHNIRRTPVVDSDGRLCGIVSRTDLLRIYLRPDGEIRRDIVDEVLTRVLWIDPAAVDVSVRNGVVTLVGQLDRRSLARLAVELTWGVAGVLDVVDHLGYRLDDTEMINSKAYRTQPLTTGP